MFEDNEQCWVILGKRLKNFWYGKIYNETKGVPSEVEFDGNWVFDREEKEQDVIGWMHTHPHFTASPSSTDHATMHSWVTCFGKPLLCGIKGTDGLKFYLYEDDESMPTKVRTLKIGNYLIGF
jgi:hypothetical protein